MIVFFWTWISEIWFSDKKKKKKEDDADRFSSGLQPFWDDIEFSYHKQHFWMNKLKKENVFQFPKYCTLSLWLAFDGTKDQMIGLMVGQMILSPSDNKTNPSSHLFWHVLYLLALF